MTDTASPYRAQSRATVVLVVATVAWIATLALARFGPGGLWGSGESLGWIAVGVNLVLGVAWIAAFVHFLRSVDELQRKVLLEALAVALGVAWVAGLGYAAADAAGLVTFEVDAAALPLVTAAAFLVAFVVGRIRYR